MKLGEIIPEGAIVDDVKATTKEEVVRELVQALVKAGRIDDSILQEGRQGPDGP